MGLVVDVRPLQGRTDSEIRTYMFEVYNVIIAEKELSNVKNMFSIRASIKHLLTVSNTYGGLV